VTGLGERVQAARPPRPLYSGRRIEEIAKDGFDGACLLCSEEKPHHCHRRLVAEYLKEKWGNIEIAHL
jgi:uncharacterized protein (DUF488 family)